MTKKQFIYWITDRINILPKFTVHIADRVAEDSSTTGVCTSYHDRAERHITIKEELFEDFPTLLETIYHETTHAVLADMLAVLVNQDIINSDVADLITERASYTTSGIVAYLLQNHDEIKSSWELMNEINKEG